MKSIMQQKDGRCYLCQMLHGDYSIKHDLEEHHVIYGTAQRKLSERFGLKIYCCAYHHLIGSEAVHNNPEISAMLKDKAQRAFEKRWPELDFRSIFGKNYKLEENDKKESIKDVGHDGLIRIDQGGEAYENDRR